MIEIAQTQYPGYFVSKDGAVLSLKTGFLKILKARKNADGYLRVNVSGSGTHRAVAVHRLIAEAWIPNPKGLPQVNHKSGQKTDNSVENLEWVTLQQNNNHAVNVLGHRRGTKSVHAKFTDDQIRAIRKDVRTLHAIAKEYGCYFSTIHKIKKRHSWAHVE